VSRTAVVVIVAVLVALGAALAVVLVQQPFIDRPTVATEAPGVWEEAIGDEPFRLTISADGEGPDGERYRVASPRTFESPLPARLEDDEIVVWGENPKDVVWVITYDEGAEALLVTRPSTGERHVLRRASP
jgi:hypothetical protein